MIIWEVEANSPNERILMFDRVVYRHLDKYFGKKYFIKRGLIDISKLP